MTNRDITLGGVTETIDDCLRVFAAANFQTKDIFYERFVVRNVLRLSIEELVFANEYRGSHVGARLAKRRQISFFYISVFIRPDQPSILQCLFLELTKVRVTNVITGD